MLIRDFRRVLPFAVPLAIFFIVVGVHFYDNRLSFRWPSTSWTGGKEPGLHHDHSHEEDDATFASQHHEIFSKSSHDGRYFMVEFGYGLHAINPSIIPHPFLNDTWIIAAQLHRKQGATKDLAPNSVWIAEIGCSAAFNDDHTVLSCIAPPLTLPIAHTLGDPSKCTGNLDFLAFNIGPHDARVFFGPDSPYIVYGSNSQFTCFGQWMADFRPLVDWGSELFSPDNFRVATEIQRPPPYGLVEKNFFIFWDNMGQKYAHYDMAPKRSFARLSNDGSVGPDLAPLATQDEACMTRLMPRAASDLESVHQATNSLSITLCKRSDPTCKSTDENTFIMTVFQHKSFYAFHGVYEPYVMLFKRTAPFEVHGISTKPLWIHGRGRPGQWKKIDPLGDPDGTNKNHQPQLWNQTEMFYVTSISWKTHGQKYHGFLDDVMFLGFGIEDARTAGVDVLAGDILEGMGYCDSF
ncbi:hypothetical protein MPDQ_001652 [Monascus purpureus]|uniref:Uncharacterized protein n=1 Tax=Monascus purpureus TaxID=5098 RepID=A0A507QPK2_MONPU|nr:hypothetical protein MPDQ_001652 [Monascus purpureus]BDD64385.1 hypothetical protein MAP00_009210 [Monascus purpureus]